MKTPSAPVLAFSYVRFSNPEQGKGDSLRRQSDGKVDAFCARHGLTLDTSVTLRDLGVSAFRGKQRSDKHDLGKFLELARRGRIPAGSYFIVENLDRLSREEERTALRLWMDILDHKINIVQLEPETIFRHEKSEMFDIIRAIMELSRGHGESAVKSARVCEAWGEKKRRARENGEVLTKWLPAWVEEKGGKLALIPERAAIVRRIFDMTANGYGQWSIVKRFAEEKVPAFGESGRWIRSYVAKILTDRRAMGELQPRREDNSADGDPIPNYFPAAVDEKTFLAARAGATERQRRPGRIAKRLNVFAGLVKNARDGDAYFLTKRTDRKRTNHVLCNANSREGTSACYSFPFDTFEAAVFSCLREIDPHEILNGDHGPDEALVLAAELAGVEAQIAALEAVLLEGDIAAVARKLRGLEAQQKELAGRLAEAQQKAAHPLSDAWGEAQGILEALEGAPDPTDARMRLRAVLRRMVSTIQLLVVPRGSQRVAAVQVWFAEERRCRSYLILHRPARTHDSVHTDRGCWVDSLSEEVAEGALDLRKPKHAAALVKVLETKFDPDEFATPERAIVVQ